MDGDARTSSPATSSAPGRAATDLGRGCAADSTAVTKVHEITGQEACQLVGELLHADRGERGQGRGPAVIHAIE